MTDSITLYFLRYDPLLLCIYSKSTYADSFVCSIKDWSCSHRRGVISYHQKVRSSPFTKYISDIFLTYQNPLCRTVLNKHDAQILESFVTFNKAILKTNFFTPTKGSSSRSLSVLVSPLPDKVDVFCYQSLFRSDSIPLSSRNLNILLPLMDFSWLSVMNSVVSSTLIFPSPTALLAFFCEARTRS